MSSAWPGLGDLPERLGPAAVAIGNFDGVHLGHQKILRAVAQAARRQGLVSIALTFEPHPLAVVAPKRAPEMLMRLEERIELIQHEGIEHVAVLPFTPELARLSPEGFAREVLAGRLRAARVVVGRSFRFGRNQAGDVAALRCLGSSLGFQVEEAGTVSVDGGPVSSTRVRRLVREGSVARARRLLGRCYSLRGPIVKGRGIGSKRTVPTLNLAPAGQMLPADGVYVTATRAADAATCRESVTNVGLRPTFGGHCRTVETFLLGELEGPAPAAIKLSFLRKIREERKFPSAESLRAQIGADIHIATRYFQRLRAVSRTSSEIPQRQRGNPSPRQEGAL